MPQNTTPASSESSVADSITGFLSHFLALPVFILLHKMLPDPDWKFHADRILLGLATIFAVELVFNALRGIVVVLFIGALAWLSYGSIWGNYGFRSLFNDYKYMLHALVNNQHPEALVISKLKPFRHKAALLKAINYRDSHVRNFALGATRKHFLEFTEGEDVETKDFIHCMAVFKEVNQWNYVNDPRNGEYFANASETIAHMSGDCDDHAIVMAACIEAVGGTARLVSTTGHLYPELLLGDNSDLERANYFIKRKLFRTESAGKNLHTHTDEFGQIWLNMDYTAKHPGGKFMDESVFAVLLVD